MGKSSMGGFSIEIFDYQRMFDSKNCQVYLWHPLTRGPASPAPPADGCTSNPLFAKLCPGACWSSIHSTTLGWWPWNATALRHSTLQKLALLEQDPVEAWDAPVSYGFSTFKANFWRIFGIRYIFFGETPVGSPQFVWSVHHWIRIMQCPARRRSKSTKLGKSWGPQTLHLNLRWGWWWAERKLDRRSNFQKKTDLLELGTASRSWGSTGTDIFASGTLPSLTNALLEWWRLWSTWA